MNRKEGIFPRNYRPLTPRDFPDLRDLDVNNLGEDVSPNLLSRVASSKKARGLSAGIAAVLGLGAVEHIVDAVKDSPPSVHRSRDWALGVQTAYAGDDNPNYIPPENPPIVPPTGPGPQDPLPGLPNPGSTPHPTPTPAPPPTVTPTPPDVCPNIEGLQTIVPPGLIKDINGNCVAPPSPPPQERVIQVEVKKRIDTDGNGQFGDQDQPWMQDFRAWVDRDHDGNLDAGEPVWFGSTDQTGAKVVFFKGTDIGEGTQVCAEEVNVSSKLEIVWGKACDVVNGTKSAIIRLLNRNKEEQPIVKSTPTPTPTPTPEPTPTPTPEAPKPPVKLKLPPLPPPIERVVTPTPVIPKTCTLPSGEEVPLPPEFQAQLVGKDAQTTARMMEEFKCELLVHVQQNTQEHEDIRQDIARHDEEMDKQHKELDKAHDATLEALGIDVNENGQTCIDVNQDGKCDDRDWQAVGPAIGVKPGEKSLAQRVDDGFKLVMSELGDIKDRVGNDVHDIWDRIGTVASVVAAGGVLSLLFGLGGRRRKQQLPVVQPTAPGADPQPSEQPILPQRPVQRPPAETPAVQPPGVPVVAVEPATVTEPKAEAPARRFLQEDLVVLAEVYKNIKDALEQIKTMELQQLTLIANNFTPEVISKVEDVLIRAGKIRADRKGEFSAAAILRLSALLFDELSDEEKAFIDQMVAEQKD